jgi:hypothetical protein
MKPLRQKFTDQNQIWSNLSLHVCNHDLTWLKNKLKSKIIDQNTQINLYLLICEKMCPIFEDENLSKQFLS